MKNKINKTIGNTVILDERFKNEIEKYKKSTGKRWEDLSGLFQVNSHYFFKKIEDIIKNNQTKARKDIIENICSKIDINLHDIIVDNNENIKHAEKSKRFILENCENDKKIEKLNFSGADTLTIATLAKAICEYNCSNDVFVTVSGKDNARYIDNACLYGTIKDSKLEGYQRTLYIEGILDDDTCAEIDVGGDNASLERIACSNLTMCIPKDILDGLAGKAMEMGSMSPFGVVKINDSNTITQLENFLQILLESRSITQAVNIAKQLRTPKAAKLLIEALDHNYGMTINSIITDSFRVFSETCKNNKSLAHTITTKLIEYINKNISKDSHSLAIIYAAEALGYVARFDDKSKLGAFQYLNNCTIKIGNIDIYRDFSWASIISMERTVPMINNSCELLKDSINMDDTFLSLAFHKLNARLHQQSVIQRRREK